MKRIVGRKIVEDNTLQGWSNIILGKPAEDFKFESSLIGLIQTNPNVEVKLGKRKLLWDNDQWVVLGRRGGPNSSYTQMIYEGSSEQEAVKALKGEE